MASFANLSANLKLNIQDFSTKLKSASGQLDRFAAGINGKTVAGMKELNKQTNAWGLNLKSVSRVVSGIIISQAFYGMAQNIRSAASAVWEFSKELEYAQIAYSNLFGNTSLANEFINVLKDFAAETPFSFTESERAAKRLLAYGIEYKNVMYVMQGVLSAASIQGDSAKIEAISRAFGQIYTYGKLMTQEVRQLSEAGIPAFEILQEELGLTQAQLRNLGHEGIPASEAINALVDGIQKRFGNVTVAAAKTISGIISNIQDNATMLFSGLFEPMTVMIKSALADLGAFIFKLREIFELKGAGGVFEALFPPEMHEVLRQFVANLQLVIMAVMRLGMAVGTLLKPVLDAVIRVFNAFAPIIATVASTLAEVIHIITSNATAMKWLTAALATAAAMWTIFKIRAIACAAITAVIGAISKALAALSAVLTFVMAHPFWTLLMVLGGVLVGLSGGFAGLSNQVSNFFKTLTGFGGVDPDKVLLPSQKERANDLDKFNKKLEGTSDAMDDLADSTGNATKAAKGLLSFDEVFKLNEPDEGSGGGIDNGIGDLGDLGGLGGLGDGFMPEIPDFSEYMDKLKSNFLDKFKKIWEEIKEHITEIAGAAIGAGFGGLMGYLLGGKFGGIIGAVLGAIVGYFWGKLADYFGLEPEQKVRAGIIGGVGAGIGAILGGLIGGPLGAKIGAIVGGIVGSFWGLIAEKLGVVDTQHFATLISGAFTGIVQAALNLFKSLVQNLTPVFIDDVFAGFARTAGFSLKTALTGAIKSGVQGAIVGLVTGMLANALTAWIAKELELTEKDLENSGIGQTIGNIIGTIAGFFIGGPAGALIGGAIGQLAGSIVGLFWEYIGNTLMGSLQGNAIAGPLGMVVGSILGLVKDLEGPLGERFPALRDAVKDASDGMSTAFNMVKDAISDLLSGDFSLFETIGETIGKVFGGIKQGASDAYDAVINKLGPIGTAIDDTFTGIKTVFTDLKKAATTVWNDIKSAISTVLKDISTAVSTVWNDVLSAIKTVLGDIWNAVSTVWNDISSAVTTVCNDVWSVVEEIWGFIKDLVVKVLTDMWNAVVEWFTPIAEEISRVCTNALNTVTTIFTNIVNAISKALNSIWKNVSSTFNKLITPIKTALNNAFNFIKQIFTKILNTIKPILTNIYNAVKSKFTSVYNSVKSTVGNVYTAVKNAFSNAYSKVKSSISNMYNSVKNGIGNIYKTFTNWISNMWTNVFNKFFTWIKDGITKLREFFNLSSKAPSTPSSSGSSKSSSSSRYGHATGGVFNREHIANFAEGNKAEAIIPLEEDTAMQPFVDAVANGLTASLAPILSNMNFVANQPQQMQPLYVGTLIADDRGLKELERKMEIIRLQESRR